MYYSGLIKTDVSNGPGVRVTIFVSGCRNHCKGCFNPETWNFKFGKEFDSIVKQEVFNSISKYKAGLTILGGDPMEPENAIDILPFIKEFKDKFPDKTIWIYSGYLYENLMKDSIKKEILDNCDVLVDGPYEEDNRNLLLKFRGSANQRIIDLKKSTPDNIVLLDL